MTGARKERFYHGRRVVDVQGSYYGALLHEAEEQGRILLLPPDPALPVYVSWDFGVSDFTVLWFFQVNRGRPAAIDYYEFSGEGLGYYAQVLLRKAARYRYSYGAMVYPHDVQARQQAEVAETRLEVLRRLLPGIRAVVVPRVDDVMDRVQASRDLIGAMLLDNSRAGKTGDGEADDEARNTQKGIQRLLMYKRPYNEKTGTYGAQPKHDEASHAADAFGTFAQGRVSLLPLPSFSAPAPYRPAYLPYS
jgi:phage terminase large subunit